jgi:hypothetical protein
MTTPDTLYQIAFTSVNGDFDVVEQFTAADDAAANAYAEKHYADQDWYVLDSNGLNINAW